MSLNASSSPDSVEACNDAPDLSAASSVGSGGASGCPKQSKSSERNELAEGKDVAPSPDRALAKLVRGGPAALAASKELVARVPQMGRADAFAWAAPLSQKLFHSDEAKEGIAAFKEKRDAAWVTGG